MPSNKGTNWDTAGAAGIREYYEIYKESSDNPVDRKKYREVIEAGNAILLDMLLKGKKMRLPYLSFVEIVKTQSLSKKIDYNHYNKTGEVKMLENEHSDGWRARLHWSKHAKPIVGASPYSIKLNRKVSQAVCLAMKVEGGHKKFGEKNYGK